MSATNKGGRKSKPVSAETVLAMFQSACGYMRQSNLSGSIEKRGNEIRITLNGVDAVREHGETGEWRFTIMAGG